MIHLEDYLLVMQRTNIVIGFLNAFPTAFTQYNTQQIDPRMRINADLDLDDVQRVGEEGRRGHGGSSLGRPRLQGGDSHHTLLIPLHTLLREQVNNHDGIGGIRISRSGDVGTLRHVALNSLSCVVLCEVKSDAF